MNHSKPIHPRHKRAVQTVHPVLINGGMKLTTRVPKSPIIPPLRTSPAFHESGHAVADYALGGSCPGIILRGLGGLAYSEHYTIGRRNQEGRWEYEPQIMRLTRWASIVGSFCGGVAESRVTRDIAGVAGDSQNIALYLRELLGRKSPLVKLCDHKKYGFQFGCVVGVLAVDPNPEKGLAAWTLGRKSEAIDLKFVEMLIRFAKLAHRIIDRNWAAVEDLANEVAKKRKMSRAEIEQIIRRHRIVGPGYPQRLVYRRASDYSDFIFSRRIVLQTIKEPSKARTLQKRHGGRTRDESHLK
jgi:hypothetical protein